MGQGAYRSFGEAPFPSAGAKDAAKGSGFPLTQGQHEAIELGTAKLRPAFGRQSSHGPGNDPPEDFPRLVAGAEADEIPLRADRSVPFGACGPIERSLGICEMSGRAGDRFGFEPARMGKCTPDPDPLKPVIAIAGVFGGGKSSSLAQGFQLAATPGEQGPDQRHRASWYGRFGPHPG